MSATDLWAFPDPLIPVLAILRAAATTGGPLDGMAFGTKDPDPAVDGGPSRPYGRLSVDYSYGQYPIFQIANLRLVTWAPTEHDANRLANRAQAVLLSYPGGPQVRSIGELTGPLPANDSGSPICTITVAARLRPETI